MPVAGSLDDRHADLAVRLAAIGHAGQLFASDLRAIVDFAIEANAAGRADLSKSLLLDAVAIASNAATAWQMLALACREMQDTAGALAAFDRARALVPDDVKIALGHAVTVQAAGRPAAALFKPILKAAPTPQIMMAASDALVAEGNMKAATAIIERAIVAAPDWCEGHERLATLRWLSGDQVRHTDHFAATLARRPGDLALWLSWYRTVAVTGDQAQAASIIDRAQAVHGALPPFAAARASLASNTGDHDRAQALFASLPPFDDHSIALAHIRHCLRTGQIPQAHDIALRGSGSDDAAAFWSYLSLIWRLMGDARAAWLDGDPPFVRVVDLPIDINQLNRLAALLRRLHTLSAQFPEQSVRGGTQTIGNLLLRLDPEIVHIRALIAAAVSNYVAALPPLDASHPLLGTPRGDVRFEGSWSVRLTGAGFHVAHTHTHGWISSALYVALPEVDAMGAPPAGWLSLGGAPSDLGIDAPPYLRVEPKPGRLVLFPATMWHSTDPFVAGERLSIAFDVARPVR